MSTPLTDERLAEIRDLIAEKLAEWAFQAAARKGIKLNSFMRYTIEHEAPERADMVMTVVQPELDRLKTRLAAAEMVCLAYGAAPARPAPSEREKALSELWWEWTELNPEADHTDAGPLTNELIGKLAQRRDAKQAETTAKLARLRELEGETP